MNGFSQDVSFTLNKQTMKSEILEPHPDLPLSWDGPDLMKKLMDVYHLYI